MKKLFGKLFFIPFILLINSCGLFQDYIDCGWLEIDNGSVDTFYRVGNNGDPSSLNSIGGSLVGDVVKKCNWIHLYKDEEELEVEREDGETLSISLSNEDYRYGKL